MEPSSNFVIMETDESTHKCTAMLLNFLQQTRKLSIGQCITSPVFDMKCAKIGQSRWRLIVFPAGQYESERDNGQLGIYLKMIECEFENEKLLVDVKFFIDSEEKFSKVVKASTFQYGNARTRWVGTNLANKLEFHNGSNNEHLMRHHDLVIGCRMIHSEFVNDEANDVEWKQTLIVESKCGNSLQIDVLPSLNQSSPSVIQSQDTETISTLSPTTREPTTEVIFEELNFSYSFRTESTAEVQKNTPHILLLTDFNVIIHSAVILSK